MPSKLIARAFLIFSGLMVFADPVPSQTLGDREFGPWTAPINLGPVLNTEKDDATPVLADNGRAIYFTSNRPGSIGESEDIWVSSRKNKFSDWNEPLPVTAVNTPAVERLRSISPDGRVMVFQSDRPGGFGGSDLWIAVRNNKDDEFGWSEPVNLGGNINSGSNEIAGNYVFQNNGQSHKFFLSSSRTDLGGLGQGDIYETEILDGGGISPLVNITELNSQFIETCFWVRQDDLEIIFSSTRGGSNNDSASFDLWRSTRVSRFDLWSAPVSLGTKINAEEYQDVNPFVSDDGTVLLFSSRRPNQSGPAGNMDIYMSTRKRLR